MIRHAVILSAAAACAGCAARTTAPPRFEGTWATGQTTSASVRVEPLGDAPNSGLQLPAVSPDGQWIAYLRHDGDRPVSPDDLLAGRGLAAMSLHVRLLAGGTARVVCPSGAAWPAWSGDGKTLAFVAFDEPGRGRLGLYRPIEGDLRYLKADGGPVISMPALDARGERIAYVASGGDSPAPALHVLTVATGRTDSCPPAEDIQGRFWPLWTADGRVVHVAASKDDSWLAQWTPGRGGGRRLARIRFSRTPVGAFQCFAAVAGPLSADDTRLAYYDTTRDRIVLVDLRDGAETDLPEATRAGCWADAGRFAVAGDEELLLAAPGAEPARVMRGAWLPRGPAGAPGRLILLGRGSHPFSFALVRLTVLAAG